MIERFWSNTIVVGSCIEWSAGKNREGYGVFNERAGKMYMAHRWLYEQTFGVIGDRHRVLLHSCDNRRCVTLQHLSPGSHGQNVADTIAKGRQAVGRMMPHAKLDEAKVRRIRELAKQGLSISRNRRRNRQHLARRGTQGAQG